MGRTITTKWPVLSCALGALERLRRPQRTTIIVVCVVRGYQCRGAARAPCSTLQPCRGCSLCGRRLGVGRRARRSPPSSQRQPLCKTFAKIWPIAYAGPLSMVQGLRRSSSAPRVMRQGRCIISHGQRTHTSMCSGPGYSYRHLKDSANVLP